ncbi:MAG: hypothetical protein ABSE73_09490 [Planctomycetota bacterium]
MSLEVRLKYGGNKQCGVTHVPSGDALAIGPMSGPTFSSLHLVGAGLGG